jgi:hypothetical protein
LPQLTQPPGTTVALGPGSPGAPGDPAGLDSVPRFGPRERRPGYLPQPGYLSTSGGSPGISGDVPSGASPVPKVAPRAAMRDTTRLPVPGPGGALPPRPPQPAPADTTKGPR